MRTDEDINSQNAAEGRTFPASIVQDILDANGNVVIPRGSPATLIVRRVTEGSTLSTGSYVLDLESVRVNGHRYVVNTEDIQKGEQGIGKNKRTAEYVGGGAVLGTCSARSPAAEKAPRLERSRERRRAAALKCSPKATRFAFRPRPFSTSGSRSHSTLREG